MPAYWSTESTANQHEGKRLFNLVHQLQPFRFCSLGIPCFSLSLALSVSVSWAIHSLTILELSHILHLCLSSFLRNYFTLSSRCPVVTIRLNYPNDRSHVPLLLPFTNLTASCTYHRNPLLITEPSAIDSHGFWLPLRRNLSSDSMVTHVIRSYLALHPLLFLCHISLYY